MAITYLQQNFAEANAPASALLFQNLLKQQLLAHPSLAWTLVEEFDSAGATIHWKVFKCANGGATVGDYYLITGRRLSDGGINMFIAEGYDAATHTATKYTPITDTTQQGLLADMTAAVFGSTTVGVSWDLAAIWPPSTFGTPSNWGWVATATAKVFFCVGPKTITMGFAGNVVVMGAFDSIMSGITDYPCLGWQSLLSGGLGWLTRHPLPASEMPYNATKGYWMFRTLGFDTNTMAYLAVNYPYLFSGQYLYGDKFQNGRVSASELYIAMTAGKAANTKGFSGFLRGKMRNVRVATGPAAAVPYDTMSIDGRKHIITTVLGTGQGVNADGTLFIACDTGVAG